VSTQFDTPAPKALSELLSELRRDSGAALAAREVASLTQSEPDTKNDIQVTGIAYDSRHVEPGNAFFSIEGYTVDGNTFIKQAIDKGASVIFSEKESGPYSVPLIVVRDVRAAIAAAASDIFEAPSKKLRLLGVTGTNGKTTTTHLIEQILNANNKPTGLIGTLGARIPTFKDGIYEGKSEYLDVKHTTPQASDLQALLFTMARRGVSHIAMEVSSHALALKRVHGCHFAAACLSNVTQDHLDFHKTMEHYWQSKRLLFEMLGKSAVQPRTAVINLDDELANEFIKATARDINLITYGYSNKASIHVKKGNFDFSGMKLELATPSGAIAFSTKLTGRFNLYNIMAAMAVCMGEGLEKEAIAEALTDFSGVSGRFEVVAPPPHLAAQNRSPLCIVDYAHTPDGLENVLKAARALVPEDGKLIALFGCGGDRDSSKRPQMGEIAENLADQVIVTSDNPRSEDPQQIIADILTGIKRLRAVAVEVDRAKAIETAVLGASAKDVIVVAGKGHETYQILRDRTIDFDDRKEVARALAQRFEPTRSK
jgi:UDP-N-acetylmuramoyl-L-alanyl-D-glutamate--2,6-diaminopimelate ligase